MPARPKIRTIAKRFLPRRFHLDDPVAQVYVRDRFRSTRLTLVNFPSLLSPGNVNQYYYEVVAYRDDGALAGRQRFDIETFGTIEIDIDDLSFADKLTPFGLITAQIHPVHLLSYKDRHLGVITAQFYALYHSRDWRSLALVHPQSSLNGRPEPSVKWTSGMLLEPEKFETVEVYQINPTTLPARSALSLVDGTGERLCEQESVLPPRSTRRAVYDSSELKGKKRLRLFADGLTCMNGKPLAFIHLSNGTFSGSHT